MGQLGYPDFFSKRVKTARRFYLDLNPSSNVHFSVVCGGFERCSSDYQIRRSGLPYLAIEFVARGFGDVTLNGKNHRLSPGSVFFYGPGISHDISSDHQHPLAKYFIDFVGKKANTLLEDNDLLPGKLVQTSSPGELMMIFESLIENGLRGTQFTQSICSLLVQQLILKAAETTIPPKVFSSTAFGSYQRCHSFIEENFMELGSLQEIAVRCGIDPAYLCRLFKRYDHQGPYQFLLRLKMNEAAAHLQNSGKLVKEVAFKMGFSDPYHFSRTFKSVFGVSPRHFLGKVKKTERDLEINE